MSDETLKKRDRLLGELRKIGPILKGSLAEVELTCGTPGCRCHSKGPKHKGLYFSYRAAQKGTTVYLRKDIAEEAKQAYDNWLKLKSILEELTVLELELLRGKAKDGRSQSKGRPKSSKRR